MERHDFRAVARGKRRSSARSTRSKTLENATMDMKATSTRFTRSQKLENAIMGVQAIAKAPSDCFSFFHGHKDQKDQIPPWPTAWE